MDGFASGGAEGVPPPGVGAEGAPNGGRDPRTLRVLIAYDEARRVYREALAEALVALRPGTRVRTVDPSGFGDAVRLFGPHLVVCGTRAAGDAGGAVAWYTLPQEPSKPSEVRLGGRRRVSRNPGLREFLEVADETARLLRAGGELEA